MPSKSKAQHNLMAMVANDPAAAKRVGIPQSVGKEYVTADKGKKFGGGGTRPDLQKANKPETHRSDKTALFKQGGQIMAKQGSGNGITKAKMGSVRTAAPSRDGVVSKGKTKGTQIKMTGSKPLGMKKGGKAKC